MREGTPAVDEVILFEMTGGASVQCTRPALGKGFDAGRAAGLRERVG